MTKQEAILAMEQGGYKVAHNLFSNDEYIWSVDENYFVNKSGLLLLKSEFWKHRQDEGWETGWKIVG